MSGNADEIKVNGNIVFKNGKLNGGLLSFILYDTYGFPFDLTKQVLKEHDIEIFEEDFNRYLEEQKKRSKSDRVKNDLLDSKNNEIFKELALQTPNTEKVFYNNITVCDAKILAIIFNNKICNEIEENKQCWIVLDKTSLYPTCGGEDGDKGIISKSKVLDTKKLYGEMIGHLVFTREKLKIGDKVCCFSFRKNVCKNHTATHLLQSALKIVLGDDVRQKGSHIDEDGLRFDFSSNHTITNDEINKIEDIINKWIEDFLQVNTVEMQKNEAEKLNGVVKLFDEKYGDKVRVVSIYDNNGIPISIEFCGGIHCKNTGEIEKFAIESEKSIGSGVRRIAAVTGLSKCLELENFRNLKKQLETIKNEMIKYKSNQSVEQRYETIYTMRKTAENINGILLMYGKNLDQEITKIVCKHISAENNMPVFAVITNKINNKNEYFCYTTCQKENNFDCRNAISKLVELTNGKGGGTINFGQAIHDNINIDYKKFLINLKA